MPSNESDDRRIASARITQLPRRLGDPIPEVWVRFDGETDECLLFTCYPDEISFRADEFVGLTEQQARALKLRKDRGYLQRNW